MILSKQERQISLIEQHCTELLSIEQTSLLGTIHEVIITVTFPLGFLTKYFYLVWV